ncbi:hypothetical protein B0T22DRAFT_373661 [Podospora appendiculata]|uniref:Swi5-dependent recombination DNA repair protein 1 n=1 Tax=Podospora appendiculata TaxID=314037 RepID=A0AAE0XJU6_9PEZI|nr:hypothetical protein B0T22DRAFT_373661 [Podospora appendiculata]
MSSSTPAKRRRVELANSTLRKPFRSPMINRPKPDAEQSETAEAEADVDAETSTPSKPGFTPSTRRPRDAISATPTKSTPAAAQAPVPMRRFLPARSNFAAAAAAAAARKTDKSAPTSPADELLEQMRKNRNEMNTRLREMQQQLDLVRQAKRIEEHSHARRPGEPVDAELRELMEKWKLASRQATEDVFELIKARVEGMGGGKAEDDGDDGGEESGNGCEEEEEGDDEGFTMVMMLKSLNIDPDVLGYDAAEDKWRE